MGKGREMRGNMQKKEGTGKGKGGKGMGKGEENQTG